MTQEGVESSPGTRRAQGWIQGSESNAEYRLYTKTAVAKIRENLKIVLLEIPNRGLDKISPQAT